MNAPAQDEARSAKTPPYVSYKTFTTFLHDLKEHGVPTRIDRSVLTRFSGVVGTQLMTTLRFLGLIDGAGNPTDRLKILVRGYGTPEWPKGLAIVLQELYGPLFKIDLATATPSHFNETFKAAFPGSDAVIQKSIAFFVQAAKEAGVEISSRILKGKKPRSGVPKPKKKPVEKTASNGTAEAEGNPPDAKPGDGKPAPETAKPASLYDALLRMLDPKTMQKEEQDAVWTLLLYLKKQEAGTTPKAAA